MMQVDTNMSIEEGQTVNYVESYKNTELAVIDVTDPAWDEVYSVPDTLLAKGGSIADPGHAHHAEGEALLPQRRAAQPRPGRRRPPWPPRAWARPCPVAESPLVTADNEMNQTSALVEPVAGGRSYGTWLVSVALGAPQSFIHEGRTYLLSMRPRRQYLPYAFTLKKFRHDVYPGTDIPKNFSSLVQLVEPRTGENRRRAHLHEPAPALRRQDLLPGQLRQGRHPLRPPGGGESRLAAPLRVLRAGHPGPARPLRRRPAASSLQARGASGAGEGGLT